MAGRKTQSKYSESRRLDYLSHSGFLPEIHRSNCPKNQKMRRILNFPLGVWPLPNHDLRRMHELTMRDQGIGLEKSQKCLSLPLGIVLRRSPGVTRWAKWVWKAVAVLPGAGPANWHELRRDGDVVEYHAATVPLELYRTDTEAYLTGLSTKVPSIYIVMRTSPDPAASNPFEIVLATASPFDGQDYADNSEDFVELVPMPEGLIALVRDWVNLHYEAEKFVKRQRDKRRTDLIEDGVGDARVSQLTDVYRAPRPKRETIH